MEEVFVLQQWKLPHLFSQSISNICFSNCDDQLLTSSWDGNVCIFDVFNNELKVNFEHPTSVLDCCFGHGNEHCFTASLDKNLYRCHFPATKMESVGVHEAAISCVEYAHQHNVVVTGSWDKTVRIWDLRASASRVAVHKVKERVCSMSIIEDRVVIATEDQKITIRDLRNFGQLGDTRKSPLESKTCCVSCYPDGYVLGSLDGYIAVDFFDELNRQAKKFPCAYGQNTAYSVNDIAIHPLDDLFATCCSGGCVNVWDARSLKCVRKLPNLTTGGASLSYNNDGNFLAVASCSKPGNDDILGSHNVFVWNMTN